MLAQTEWTPQEQWVWEKIKNGEDADFNLADGYGGVLKPTETANWPTTRVLRLRFTRTES